MWLHLAATPSKVLTLYHELIATLVHMLRTESCWLLGREPHFLCITFSKQQQDWLFQHSATWAIAFANYTGRIDNHSPQDKLLQFASLHQFIFPSKVTNEPLSNAILIFADGSFNEMAAYTMLGETTSWKT